MASVAGVGALEGGPYHSLPGGQVRGRELPKEVRVLLPERGECQAGNSSEATGSRGMSIELQWGFLELFLVSLKPNQDHIFTDEQVVHTVERLPRCKPVFCRPSVYSGIL